MIVGASGTVGHAATERFLRDEEFDVITVSRRRPDVAPRGDYRHFPVDLRSAAAVTSVVQEAGPVTDVVYAALHEQPNLIAGWVAQEQISTNRLMFANVLSALRTARPPVGHMSVLQGTKAYGYHLAKMRIPGKERQPRVAHDNFYWEQEDLLVAAAQKLAFAYTIFRPQFIFGGTIGVAMNLIPVIGTYAAISRELGRPLSYPGGASYVAEAVDSRLLANALRWAASSPSARNQTFNITNGDVFEWRDIWGSIAKMLGISPGPDEPLSLAAWLPQQEHIWAQIVERNGLRPLSLHDIVGLSHQYADDAFAYTPDGSPLASRSSPVLLSTIKLRQAGFGDCIDTEDMFAYWFERLRAARVLPA